MKMTRLEWRYLQRIALDHPYYDTHKPPLSDTEARAIMEANNTMTGREFVDSIYAKLGMPRPVREKKRLAWLHNIGELFTVPPIRKIAIAILVVILFAVFFTATPTGRAIAESVIQYIVNMYDGKGLVVNRSDSEAVSVAISVNDAVDINEQNDEGELKTITIQSFEEFSKKTGKTPIILPLPYTELYYDYDEEIDYLVFYSTYETSLGCITVYQVWNVEEFIGSSLTNYTLYDTDESVYYSIEEEKGYVYCIKIYEDSVLNIASKGNYTIDDIVDMLQ